jgi:DNA-binding transcriptional ArsR family regulator
MARAATTTDVYNAIAEPRRRELIEALARARAEAYTVTELVRTLGIPQPAVSKHLAVLRKVGLVRVTKRGQQRLYELNAEELKPVYDWTKTFERFWTRHLDNIKARAERLARERAAQQQQQDQPRKEK